MESVIGHSRRRDITFWRGGRIEITAHVAKSLALADGDSIDVGEQEGERYLYVRHRKTAGLSFRYEATAHTIKAGSHCMRAYSAKLSRSVLGWFGAEACASPQLGEPEQDARWGVIIPMIKINLADNG